MTGADLLVFVAPHQFIHTICKQIRDVGAWGRGTESDRCGTLALARESRLAGATYVAAGRVVLPTRPVM